MRGRTTKWVVREVARQHLPTDIVDRPKVGVKVSRDDWFRAGLGNMADLLRGILVRRRHIRPGGGGQIARCALLRDRNEPPPIWTLLSVEVWHRELDSKLNSATA